MTNDRILSPALVFSRVMEGPLLFKGTVLLAALSVFMSAPFCACAESRTAAHEHKGASPKSEGSGHHHQHDQGSDPSRGHPQGDGCDCDLSAGDLASESSGLYPDAPSPVFEPDLADVTPRGVTAHRLISWIGADGDPPRKSDLRLHLRLRRLVI